MRLLRNWFGSWLALGLLVLVIAMLTVEPAQRKPLLVRTGVTTCRVLSWTARSAATVFASAGNLLEAWADPADSLADAAGE